MPVPALARRAAIAAAATLTLALAAPSADAGTYTVHSCRTPDGGPASAEGWSWSASDTAQTSFESGCPAGGITLRLLPGLIHSREATANMRFTAPTATDVVSYRVWSSVQLTTAERYFYSATESLPDGGEEWWGPRCGGWSNSCSAVGDPADPFGEANLVARTPDLPLSQYGVYISCGLYKAEDPDCAATSPISAEATVWRAETLLVDETAPDFPAAPAGSLLGGGALAGVQHLSTIATDQGGGVAATSLEVDGQVLDRQTFSDPNGVCREPYTQPVPCPTTASGTLQLDTTQLPDGVHSLRVLATDVAGTTRAWGPVAFTTDNADVVCAPGTPPAGSELRLSTWVAGEPRAKPATVRRRSVTVALGRGARLDGELTGAGGAPVAGAGVCVGTRTAGGSLRPLTRLVTDAAGRFAATIPAGTSRQVWAVHRVGANTVSAKAVVAVRARVKLKPARTRLRRGAVLTMRGRLDGRPIPGDGVLVNVQARRGRGWQTFRQVRVHSSGRFRVRYRFVGGPGVHRYALRAEVPRQSAYLYAPAASRPFRVRVAG